MTDVLSDVLRHVRLSGAVFFSVEATAPWVAEAPAAPVLAPLVMPGAQHVLEYHVVTWGRCYGGLVGEEPTALEAGDVIMFPQGDGHVMSSAPGMRGPTSEVLAAGPPYGRLPIAIHEGPDGPKNAHVICGFIGCDVRPFNPLIAALPRVLVSRAEARRQDDILEPLLSYAVAEARERRAGTDCVLTKLSELLFVEIVRRYVEGLPTQRAGWISGMRDGHVGSALAELHARPEGAWTLESLSRAAGLSRSAFAERFTTLVGVPPMQYLAQWRMQVASGWLARGTLSLAEVATQVGYESEAAFSRAFKKIVGTSPGQWRRDAAGADGVSRTAT